MTRAALLQGIAVAFAIEGLVYAVAPGFMRRLLAGLAAAPDGQIRLGGLMTAVSGVGIAWLLHGG